MYVITEMNVLLVSFGAGKALSIPTKQPLPGRMNPEMTSTSSFDVYLGDRVESSATSSPIPRAAYISPAHPRLRLCTHKDRIQIFVVDPIRLSSRTV